MNVRCIYATLLALCLFLYAAVTTGCEIPAVNEQSLRVEIPPPRNYIPRYATAWKHSVSRIAFFIDGTGKIAHARVDKSRRRVSIHARKKNAIPVLVCVEVRNAWSALSATAPFATPGSAGCPFAVGGIYPFDATDISVLQTNSGVFAAAARLLLVFAKYGGNINSVNVMKLRGVIEKYAPSYTFNMNAFFKYIRQNRLSVYAIKNAPTIQIAIPPHARAWFASWTHAGYDTVPQRTVKNNTTAKLPTGAWLFVSPDATRFGLATIGLDAQKNKNNSAAVFKEYAMW